VVDEEEEEEGAKKGTADAQLPEDAGASAERNALLNALRHSGRAEVGAVISKVIGEFPELKTMARSVAAAAGEAVKRINSMTPQQQEALLKERYPDAQVEQKAQANEREGLPPLPNAGVAVVLRLPPEPSGYMHIGHAMAGLINYIYRETYSGKLWLRFEDTNPKKVEKRYYDSFRRGYTWLGVRWDEEKNVSSDVELIYGYGRRLLERGEAYACTCDAEKVKKLRFDGVACEHRGQQDVEKNLSIWEGMLAKRFKEGEVVIRLRGDLGSLDYSMRDPNLFRIIEKEHPLTGTKYCVWPVYDFEVVIEDEICHVSHILRSSEFHVGLQEKLRELFSFGKIEVIQFSRFNFKGTPVQKRLLRPLVQEHLVEGWDDPRMPTIEGIRRRGILPRAIREFTLQVGYTKSEHEYDWSLLFAVNRKLLDPISRRLFFVPNPVKLEIEGAPRLPVTIPFHPENDLGKRTISVGGEVYLPLDDLRKISVGETFRLMELYNVKLVSNEGDKVRATYAGEALVRESRKVQWVTPEGLVLRVLEPSELYREDGTFNTESLKVREGLVEPHFANLSIDEIIQFPRYGFCRVDSKDTCVLAHK
jgi:glutamyl-tRNA synthetase